MAITMYYILVSVGRPWPSFKVTVVWEIINICAYFLRKFTVGMREIECVASSIGLLEVMLSES